MRQVAKNKEPSHKGWDLAPKESTYNLKLIAAVYSICFQWTGTPHWTGESDALVPIIVEPVVEVGGNIDLLLFEIPSDSDT